MTPTAATAIDFSRQAGPDFVSLRERVIGAVVTPQHELYDEARQLHNLGYDRRPGVIVRVAGEADVVECVRFARESGLEIAVRSGGHSVAGYSVMDGALVIDFSEYRAVSIDPSKRTARVQTGARSADIAAPAHAYGLALSTGDTSSVGIGGLATGGGIGYMVRKYGLAADNMLSVRMVTAEGKLVTASRNENPDLFWAVRGGGGNFGVITEFEFRLAPVGSVFGGEVYFPATREAVRAYLDYARTAPDELTTIAHLRHAPPAPFIPEDRVGELCFSIIICYAGDLEEGERVVAPLRALGEPIADVVGPIPYPAIFAFMGPAAEPHLAEVKMSYAHEISDEAIDGMIAATDRAAAPFSMVQLRVLGGAMARVPVEDTAFAHRDKQFMLTALGLWLDPAEDGEAHRQWARELWQSWQSFADGCYVNFLSNEGELRIRQAYPKATMSRLAEVKRRYDPANVFHNNQNIKPAR